MKKTLSIIIWSLLLIGTLTNCNPTSSAHRASNCAVKITQGVYGRVFWISGNQMPGLGMNDKKSKKDQEATKPVKRQLLIYPLMSRTQLQMSGQLFQVPTSKPFAKTMADEDGCFQIKLPPGKYSIFTLEEDRGQQYVFANLFDGQGNANPVEVKSSKLSELNIKINYKAVF